MKSKVHLIISLILALIALYFTGSYLISVLVIIAGFLVDFDHLFDYCFYLKKKSNLSKFRMKEFLSGRFFKKSGKAYVLLHSYELVGVVFLYGALSGGSLYLWLSLSLLIHLLLDQFGNIAPSFTYFLVYRMYKQFDFDQLCRGETEF